MNASTAARNPQADRQPDGPQSGSGTGPQSGPGGAHTETGGTDNSSAEPWCSDPYADALRAGRGPLFLRRTDGWLLPLEVERWCAGADPADMSVLERCEGTVLDIGCGPGRLVAALAGQGTPTLGIDTSTAAVARTRRLGGAALRRSVFDPLPGEGHWRSVLLLDGNIGIGGDAAGLLDRAAQLLAPDGLLLAEAAPAEVEETVQVRLDDGSGGSGAAFPWVRLGPEALRRCAESAGWSLVEQWCCYERSFLSLRSPRRSGPHHTSTQPAASAVPASESSQLSG